MEPLIVVGILLVAAVAFGAWYYAHKRRQEFAAFAAQHGLGYAADDPFDMLGLPFALFRKGDGRGIDNVLWGPWRGEPIRAFDYWYYDESTDSGGGRSRTYHRHTCVLLEHEGVFPPLAITRESLFTRIADGLGFRDIELESEEFNRAFQVKAKDRRFAVAFLDALMMRWLLALPRRWEFEVAGAHLLAWEGKRMAPAGFAPVIEMALAFRENVPRAASSMYGPGSERGEEQRT
jgi:hypothetical protein